MPVSIDELRAGLKTRLATISGLNAYATMPASPKTPAAAVIPKNARFDQDFDGDATYLFEVWVYVNPSDLNRAQTAIDAYLAPTGSNSIRAAINADPTLGGKAHSTRVIGWEQYASLVDIAGGQLLGAAVQVEVFAS